MSLLKGADLKRMERMLEIADEVGDEFMAARPQQLHGEVVIDPDEYDEYRRRCIAEGLSTPEDA